MYGGHTAQGSTAHSEDTMFDQCGVRLGWAAIRTRPCTVPVNLRFSLPSDSFLVTAAPPPGCVLQLDPLRFETPQLNAWHAVVALGPP